MDANALIERVAVSALKFYQAAEYADTLPNDIPAADLVEAHKVSRARFDEMMECIMDLAEA